MRKAAAGTQMHIAWGAREAGAARPGRGGRTGWDGTGGRRAAGTMAGTRTGYCDALLEPPTLWVLPARVLPLRRCPSPGLAVPLSAAVLRALIYPTKRRHQLLLRRPRSRSIAATDCTPQSKECCATNQAVWQWLEKADPSSYPPAWNWAGKHLFDKCGKLRKSVSKESASVKSLAPDITKLLAETPQC